MKPKLNKAGIRQLADDLVAHKDMYDQNVFGSLTDCGTVCCMITPMALNKQGIRQLADDLVSHKRLYDQDTEGRVEACGTVGCMAGFCLARKIGRRKYNKRVRSMLLWGPSAHQAGREQLGIEPTNEYMLQIFGYVDGWPSDLYELYKSNGPRCRVIAALKALQRLSPDGKIDPNPKVAQLDTPYELLNDGDYDKFFRTFQDAPFVYCRMESPKKEEQHV